MKANAGGRNRLSLDHDPKEIAVAKTASRTAIIVAVISLLSLVAVALIGNIDKIGVPKTTSEELGFYEARLGIVESALTKRAEQWEFLSHQAQGAQQPELAHQLTDQANATRRELLRFQEGHAEHQKALDQGKRLDASKIRLKMNQSIVALNNVRIELNFSGSLGGAPLEGGQVLFFGHEGRAANGERDLVPIPLYGKIVVDTHEELAD